MKTAMCVLALAAVADVSAYNTFHSKLQHRSSTGLRLVDENNSDMFGGPMVKEAAPAGAVAAKVEAVKSTGKYGSEAEKLKEDAANLRKEAAQMEVAMREEARAKGLPEEMINKLIPLR
jgi:hypothetical protein